jgi:putative peptidoglycan lipid II flippase
MEPQSATQTTANRQIARAAGTVMVAFLLTSVISLARGVIVLRTFGTGMENDAFNAANRVSETLYNLVAGGALASAFIPTLSGFLAIKDKKGAWKLASSIVNLVIIIISFLAFLAAIFAPQVVRYLLAPDWYAFEPEKFLLTVQILRVILPAAVLFGISGLVMGILNAHQNFLFPALAPSMYSLGIIFGVIFLSPSMGIFGMAWGVVIGSAMHLLVQIPKLIQLGGKYYPSLGLENPAVKEVGLLMLPRLAGVAVVQLNFWVNTNLASGYSEGSVTGLTYGFTLMLMPLMFIAQAIATASLPTFSEQVALGKHAEMRSSLASALRAVLLLSIPASVGMILLRIPLVQLLYQNGEAFTSESTQLVAWALLWYAAGLVGHSVVEIVSRAFYALHDTRTPVIVGVCAMTINIILSILLGKLFLTIGWMPHGGLALANSIATGLEALALIYLMRSRLKGLEGSKIFAAVWRALLAVIIMVAVLYPGLMRFSNASAFLLLFAGGLLGVFIYGLMITLLKTKEIFQLFDLFRQKVLVRLRK